MLLRVLRPCIVLLLLATALAAGPGPASAQIDTDPKVAEATSLGQLINAPDFRPDTDPEILRLYDAFFSREPDVGGAQYWIGVSKGAVDGSTYPAIDIAGFFVGSSAEFENTYENAPDNAEFLRRVYNNVLGRAPEAGGFNYWLDILDGTNTTGNNPSLTQGDRGEVIYYVAINDEFVNRKPYLPGTGTSVTFHAQYGADDTVSSIKAALDQFHDETGISVRYEANHNLYDLRSQSTETSPPNLAVMFGTSLATQLTQSGALKPLPASTVSVIDSQWPAVWTSLGDVGGTRMTAPVSADPKSLVWYRPAEFAARGYTVPDTIAAITLLEAVAINDGLTPYCVGIESGGATGWYYTDEVEEDVLRWSGAATYDNWIDRSIPFTDPAITDAMQRVMDRWSFEGMVYAGGGSIADTNFSTAVADFGNEQCLMHRQGSFTQGFLTETDDVDVFLNPGLFAADRPVNAVLASVGAFDDRPEVLQVLEYFSSATFANRVRMASSDEQSEIYSAAFGVDTQLYNRLDRRIIETIRSATVGRPDASDEMDPAVGVGAFWAEGTLVVSGEKTVADAAAAIEAAFP